MVKTIKNLIFVLFISVIIASCSNANVKANINEKYCNELRVKMVSMLKTQITNDSLYIIEVGKAIDFIEANNFNVTGSSNIEKLAKLEMSVSDLDNKFNTVAFESLRLELIKEYYNIEDDKELNDIIDRYYNYASKKNDINDKHRECSGKVKVSY